MEKALTTVSSLKVGSLWISKKAKEELSNISQDINVSLDFTLLLDFLPQFLWFWYAFQREWEISGGARDLWFFVEIERVRR